jgi:hypothetical protein
LNIDSCLGFVISNVAIRGYKVKVVVAEREICLRSKGISKQTKLPGPLGPG